MTLVSSAALANNPFSPQRMGLGNSALSASAKDVDAQISELNLAIEQIKQREAELRQQVSNYSEREKGLQHQIEQAKQHLYPNQQALTNQLENAHRRLTQLKQAEAQLALELSQYGQRQRELPSLIRQAKQALAQQIESQDEAPQDAKLARLQRLRETYLRHSLQVLEAEQELASPLQTLKQLRLEHKRAQIITQDDLLEQLNLMSQQARSTNAERALELTQGQLEQVKNPLLRPILEQNLTLANALQELAEATDAAQLEQQQLEVLYQKQSLQLSQLNQQLQLMEISAAYGDNLLQHLWQLKAPPSASQLESKLNDARLYQFQYQQQQGQLQRQLPQDRAPKNEREQLLLFQLQLLDELVEQFGEHVTELTRLRVVYEQLSQQYSSIEGLLNEHLFWVPNAVPINSFWLGNLGNSLIWMLGSSEWQSLYDANEELSHLWAWWLILLVLFLVVHDIVSRPYQTLLKEQVQYVGKVTQDGFSHTLTILAASIGYAALLAIPVILAGFIYLASDVTFVRAVGVGIASVGSLFFLYRLAVQLAHPHGVLIGHFRRKPEMVNDALKLFFRFSLISLPLVGLLGFSEFLDNSLFRNSIGRGVFILFALVLWYFYLRLNRLLRGYRMLKNPDKNQQLLERGLWLVLLIFPLACAGLAIKGYFYTASQLLTQLQLSVLLGLTFQLAYMMVKRWMLIEQRRIAFERAKARRAEQLAQRESSSEPSQDPIVEAIAENADDQMLDLDTIQTQSLGLMRTLFILGFLLSLVGLWTQTQTAFLSMLDGVTLWNTISQVNGIEQAVPITLKSVLAAVIIVGVAWVIASNLPGLLELVILQRLELTPGTGFAIATVSRYLVVMLGLFIAFGSIGVEWSKLQWLIAALSVGLGFGLQEIFANFISGLIILMEKPVRIGDTVTIRDLTGTVSKIQIRATTIMDWDRKEIIVPNKAFITEQLINWSLSDPITRVIIKVSVARDSDPSLVEALLHQSVKESEFALDLPEPEVWFAGFGQHTQDYEVRAYAKEMAARWPLKHDLHKKISARLKDNGVDLAYPQLEIHMSGKGGTNLGDGGSILKS
ncbi:mechanosensitive ion channel domain-containing protein [Paraferrimonas sedimenticola]|uniref:Mechanosensitive ion channel protein MscS n=1 Tax=Paraferrimonas sedimenticola TaxID=375674 RepID=A0AA37RW05_9GAMM|nr:mechanosensitive ion channel domain-containing protein [Paraferrimonas sedimenticola]GLP95752.1 mechanosensitive ion channel protein MscS [Paraferrimonas sedimenticola]